MAETFAKVFPSSSLSTCISEAGHAQQQGKAAKVCRWPLCQMYPNIDGCPLEVQKCSSASSCPGLASERPDWPAANEWSAASSRNSPSHYVRWLFSELLQLAPKNGGAEKHHHQCTLNVVIASLGGCLMQEKRMRQKMLSCQAMARERKVTTG